MRRAGSDRDAARESGRERRRLGTLFPARVSAQRGGWLLLVQPGVPKNQDVQRVCLYTSDVVLHAYHRRPECRNDNRHVFDQNALGLRVGLLLALQVLSPGPDDQFVKRRVEVLLGLATSPRAFGCSRGVSLGRPPAYLMPSRSGCPKPPSQSSKMVLVSERVGGRIFSVGRTVFELWLGSV